MILSVVVAPRQEPGRAVTPASEFAVLADAVRLRLLSLLGTGRPSLRVRVVEPLDRSQPTVSHHSKVCPSPGSSVGEKRWALGLAPGHA